MMKINPYTVIKRTETQVSSALGEEVAILETKHGIYYSLKCTGASIWDELRENKTLEQLVEAIVSGFVVDKSECLTDVRDFLEDLMDHNLIEIVDS
jgi:hypothetical protein